MNYARRTLRANPKCKSPGLTRSHFKDGTSEEVDIVIASTGYKTSFPFFEKSFINFEEGNIPLYKKVFHPEYKNLFFIGLVQPMGCIWPLADAHAKLAANYIAGNYQLPANTASSIKKAFLRII